MNQTSQRLERLHRAADEQPIGTPVEDETPLELGFDDMRWSENQAEHEPAGAGGRAVLGAVLGLLAMLWIGLAGWSAGQALAGEALSAPAAAQWLAVAAGPLALLGLGWLMFGRTRRREAERFTRSVVAMRTEARSLEGLLAVLTQRIGESQSALGGITQTLMRLGDEATSKLDGVTRDLDASSQRLAGHGAALDQAAANARTDIGVMLEDLPRAELIARAAAEQMRAAGTEALHRAGDYERQVGALGERTRATDEQVGASAGRLVAHLTQIESAGAAAAVRVGEAEASFGGALDLLLERTARTLEEIRAGIDTQSAAVLALVDQSSVGIGRAGIQAADALGLSIGKAGASLDGLSVRVAEQDRASQRMLAEIERGLTLIDGRFAELASQGDERANHFLGSLGRARAELDALAAQTSAQGGSIAAIAERTDSLRDGLERLSAEIRDGVTAALGEAEGGAGRLQHAASLVRPEVGWVRDAAVEASDRLAASGAGIADQQDRLTSLLAAVDDGVAGSEAKLAVLAAGLAEAQAEAARLTAETSPALVTAMVQVREAAAHAAERAREAIASIIPETSDKLSQATRAALEAAIREGVEERIQGVQQVAAQAVASAQAASERLTQQMLSLGQSAAALDQHFQHNQAEQREKDSEAFARRVALLMDSMHSAAIDVSKILSDEVDERAWDSYLKGNRGVFTRRAVKLMAGGEARAIGAHYDSDPEFQGAVNRYVHDFEAMIRRVLAERDGGMIAVTLMSSDMGKLYAALADGLERRR